MTENSHRVFILSTMKGNQTNLELPEQENR